MKYIMVYKHFQHKKLTMACRSCGSPPIQIKEQDKVVVNADPTKLTRIIKTPEIVEQRDFIETIIRGSPLDLEIQKATIDKIVSITKIAEGVYRILSLL